MNFNIYRFQSTKVTVACQYRNYLNGDMTAFMQTLTCQSDGTWSEHATCQPSKKLSKFIFFHQFFHKKGKVKITQKSVKLQQSIAAYQAAKYFYAIIMPHVVARITHRPAAAMQAGQVKTAIRISLSVSLRRALTKAPVLSHSTSTLANAWR